MPNKKDQDQYKVPWKAIASGALAVGGAHAVGYHGAGVAAKAISKSRLGNKLNNLSPLDKQRVVRRIAAGSSMVGGGAVALREHVRTDRLRKEVAKLKKRNANLRSAKG